MTDQLITKYRPTQLKDFVGNSAVVASLEKHLANGNPPQCYLFGGDPGMGKTTLAGIIAGRLDCGERIERDAPQVSGVDAMRDMLELIRRPPLFSGAITTALGKPARRAIIIDECHGLSRQAWDTLLITLEQGSTINRWFFSTSQPAKVPKAVRQRCAEYLLKPCTFKQLQGLLDDVADREKLTTPDDILDLCADRAEGSPRQALANLDKVKGFTKIEDARDLLQGLDETTEAVEIPRLLVKRAGFNQLVKAASKIEASQIETVRYVTVNYLSKVLVGKGVYDPAILQALRAFSKPFPPNEGYGPLLLAIDEAVRN